jgi:drug/metabolite transporter (DMT)-like permease
MRWILVGVMVGGTVLSDLLQSYQMKRAGEQPVSTRGAARLIRKFAYNRDLLLSILCLAFSFFAFMALVQTAPLSFAVPASAASLVIETVLARTVLHEEVGSRRWAGALFVLAGIVLLGR